MPKGTARKKVCVKCGVAIRDGSLFCYSCGHSVRPEPEPEMKTETPLAEVLQTETDGQSGDKTLVKEISQPIQAGISEATEPVVSRASESQRLRSASSLRKRPKIINNPARKVVFVPSQRSPWFYFLLAVTLAAVALSLTLFAMYLK